MLFCAFVCTAWAGPTDLPEITTDLENPIYYTIVNTRSSQPGGFMYYAGDEVGLKDGWTLTDGGLDNKYKFFFTGSHEALYVHNAATGKKLATIGNGNKAAGSWTDEGTVWAVGVSPMGGGLAFGPQGGLNGGSCWNECNYATDPDKPDFTTWSANDAGSIFLCTKVSELDIPATDKFYVIEAPLFNKVQGVQKGLYVNGENAPAWGTIDLTDKAYYWVATVNSENGQVAFKNAKTQTYLNGAEMSQDAAYGTIKYLGDDQWNIVVNGITVHANNHGGGGNPGGNIVSWGAGLNTASAWTFIEKADPDAVVEVEVVYNFTYNGVARPEVTQTVTTLVGEEYPKITTLPYGVAASKPEGVIANADVVDGKVTKTIEVTNNLPFVPANSYADIPKWYYIEMHSSAGYGKYLQDITTGIEWADTEVDVNNVGTYAWAFVGNPFDGFKLVNYAAGNSKGVNADPTVDPVVEPVVGDIATATQWVIKPSRTNKEAQYFCFQYPNSDQYMNAQSGAVKYWNDADQGSTMWVTECNPASQSVTVTYSYKYNGVEFYTQSKEVLVGEEYPDLVTLPYGVSAVKPEGLVAADATNKDIELVINLPFEFAADYASIKNWYYIQMHLNPEYTKYIQAVEGYIEWADASVNANEIDTYTWGFIGNPFAGFKLVNYGKGAEMGVNSDGSGDPAMGDIATATAWTIKPSSANSDAQYFCFQYPGSANYMNAQGGKVAFWNAPDNGSTMWVTERDLSGATELQAVIDQVEAFVAAGVAGGTTVGYLTSESAANVATALAAAKEAVAAKTGCIEAQAALQAAVAAVKTIQPEEGKFYVIASAMPESDARSGQKMYPNNDGYMHFQTADAFANVFQFEDAGEGKFYLRNVQSGAYLNTAKGHGGGQQTMLAYNVEAAKSVTIANMGKANSVKIVPTGGAMMHAQGSGASVVGWNNAEATGASAWTIQEVNIADYTHTVNVTAAGWATLYLGYNAAIPAGVKAYAVAEVADYATLAEVTGVLPANQAVLLEAAEGAYEFDYATGTPASIATNLLKGTVYNTNIAEEAYVLGYVGEEGNEEVGFYTATLNQAENTAFKNNAFKAYLPKTGVAPTLRFNFGGTTAIESVLNNGINANAAIYDLSGRRVEKATKGIYIVNGKKMIVK